MIPQNYEKYISFSFDHFKFIDSAAFLHAVISIMTRFFMMKFTSRKFTSRAGLNLAGADPALPHQYSSNIALGDVTVYLGMTK